MSRRKRGERADGLIQVTATVGIADDGKRIRKSFYGHTRQEAEQRRAEYLDAQKHEDELEANDMTLSRWIDIFKERYRVNVNPLYIACDDVPYNRLKSVLGNRRLSSITESDLQHVLNGCVGMSFSTVTKYIQAIRRIFRRAASNRLIPYDPSASLTMPKYTKGTHRALGAEEQSIVLSLREHRVGLWVELMMLAGLRRGEMIALRWEDVDLSANVIRVRQSAVIAKNQSVIQERTKTQAGIRDVPICAELARTLHEQKDKTGLVCRSARGTQLSETAVRRGMQTFNAEFMRRKARLPIGFQHTC